MKTIRPYETFGTRGLILILATLGVSIGVGFASPAFAQTFPKGAVIVNPDGKVTNLGFLHGTDINDSGRVVGYFFPIDSRTRAFITGPNGMGMTDLSTLGGSESSAFGINDSGQVVGYSHTTGGDPTPS